MKSFVLIVAFALLLCGCGRNGPLYLPKKDQSKNSVSSKNAIINGNEKH